MYRRSLIAFLSLSLTSLAGCLDNLEFPNLEGNENESPNGEEHDGAVMYAELPEFDQHFFEAAESYHSIQWIPKDGGRVYLESSTDGYIEAEDPLISEDLSEEGQEILGGEMDLLMNDDRYRVIKSSGHGLYAWRFEASVTETCAGETWEISTFTDPARLVFETAIEDGEVFFAKAEFEAVTDADIVVDPDEFELEDRDIVSGDDCIITVNDSYEIDIVGEYHVYYDGYHLEQIDDTD